MMTLAHPKLINRVAQNQNFTYFAVGFSVILLMIVSPKNDSDNVNEGILKEQTKHERLRKVMRKHNGFLALV